MVNLLLLSNSTNFGEGYLDHALEAIRELLGRARRLLFVPFALRDHAAYTAQVRERFAREGIEVEGATPGAGGARALAEAQAVFVGGGNTFRLLDTLQGSALVEPLRLRAVAGMPYLGSSAGSVVAAPTLKTTNDMPIVQPESFEALGLVPFQINAHYIDPDPASRHMGETREERIREFLEENEDPVVGLREGSWLRIRGERVWLGGKARARIFPRGGQPVEVDPGGELQQILGGEDAT